MLCLISKKSLRCCQKFARRINMLIKHQKPSPPEVLKLNAMFPDPECTIDRLLVQLSSHSKSTFAPKVEIEPRLDGLLWRAYMSFSWPVEFRVAGESDVPDRAKHYAYLQACGHFQHFGLLSTSGEVKDWKEQLGILQDFIAREFRDTLDIKFTKGKKDAAVFQSILNIGWPYDIRVVGHGATQAEAEMAAAGLAIFKLKIFKYVNTDLTPNLSRRSPTYHIRMPALNESAQKPDYEVWVDASMRGFGAYLVSHVDDGSNSSTRWFHEFWSHRILDNYVRNSAVIEFYALVTAIFTWKKKFQGCSVLVRTDSLTSMEIIRCGLNVRSDRKNDFLRLFKTLIETCSRYKIQLQCQHVKRAENRAADLLSKQKTEKFFEMVPNTSAKAKKTKNLAFMFPIGDIDAAWTTKKRPEISLES